VTDDELQALFEKAPASFDFSRATDGSRIIGTSEGVALDIWFDHVVLVAIFPPDRTDIAARNGVLMLLLIAALRKDWNTAEPWLSYHIKAAAKSKKIIYEALNYSRGVTFRYDKQNSRATLSVSRREPSVTTGA
jgi:hypothetical protein